ncbi:MAG: histidine phosphatase family protein [Rhodospirillaceae bacterium]|nr:histidine phosphatase family protein [Rhodospirillaceae bacterium]
MLHLARHGQTEWNLEHRLQGGRDSPLTKLGERQAKAVASCLTARGPCPHPREPARPRAEDRRDHRQGARRPGRA